MSVTQLGLADPGWAYSCVSGPSLGRVAAMVLFYSCLILSLGPVGKSPGNFSWWWEMQDGKPHHASILQAFSGITYVAIPLAKLNHMTKPKIEEKSCLFNERNCKGTYQRVWGTRTTFHIQMVILIDAGTWCELETMTCRSSYVDRDRFLHLLHPHRCHSANIFCSMDINYAKFIHVWSFEFVCCLVCWLFCFGYFTSFKPLITFEMPVNLFHCVFCCSIPDDTKKSSEGQVICPRDI